MKLGDYLSEQIYDELGETLPEIQDVLDGLPDTAFDDANELMRRVRSALAGKYGEDWQDIDSTL